MYNALVMNSYHKWRQSVNEKNQTVEFLSYLSHKFLYIIKRTQENKMESVN